MAHGTAAIAAGGTGGHLFPAVAVAERLRERGIEVLLCTGDSERDRRLARSLPEWLTPVRAPSRRPPSRPGPGLAAFAWNLWIEAGRFGDRLRERDVRVLLAMGGFPTLVPALAARRRRIPLLLHEANAVPGRANRWLARGAEEVLLGWPETSPPLGGARSRVTGIPVRREIFNVDRAQARRSLGLDPDAFVIAVIGGSQGAEELNRAARDAFEKIREKESGTVMILLAGHGKAPAHETGAEGRPGRFRVIEFEDRMGRIYAAADLVVSRAGAGTLAELAASRTPAILVPYPHAADRHQHANAGIHARNGAAVVIDPDDLDAERLAERIVSLARDPERLRRMARALAEGPDPRSAAERVVERITAYLDPAARGALRTTPPPPAETADPPGGERARDAAGDLRRLLSQDSVVRHGEPMARYTRLRIGGAADLFVEPASVEDLSRVMTWARENGWPVYFLGHGSNVLVRDGGVRGIVVRLRSEEFTRIERVGENRIRAGAGASLKAVIRAAREWGIGGLEFLEGIPGTVGGAVRMNAGAMGSEMVDVLRGVQLAVPGREPAWRDPAELGFRYRGCDGLGEACVTAVELEGTPADPERIFARLEELGRRRRESQPGGRTAGCTFRNPEGIPAGRLIEELGLKGLRRGGAHVSEIHANFIMNDGGATAADVLWLMDRIRRTVRRDRGIDLEPEVIVFGEDAGPKSSAQEGDGFLVPGGAGAGGGGGSHA